MTSSLRTVLVAGALSIVAGPMSGKTGRESGPEQMLSIHLHNQAQVPAGVLHSATVETSRVFQAVGIRITWEQSAVEKPPYLVVRLVRQVPKTTFPGALGFALPFARTEAQVSIFYDRVEALSWSVGTALPTVLGYSMAHEIGHVLLRSPEHSATGLMQARWNRESWRSAAKGWLAFRREEVERMGAGLKILSLVPLANNGLIPGIATAN